MTTTITPLVTPQQQMALAFRGFPLPEVTPKTVATHKGPATRYLAFTIRDDGQWVEALGRDTNEAVAALVREVSRP
jgi:hypothetical protein